MGSIAYLGPEGTFSQEAVETCPLLAELTRKPLPTLRDVYRAAGPGDLAMALVPLESSAGAVTTIHDLFITEPGPQIRREVLLPIRLHLMAKGGHQVRRVLSHAQALAQCRSFLKTHLPEANVEPVSSTAEAARLAAEHPGWAAIGSRAAAEHFDLPVLVEDLQGDGPNTTRFVVLALTDELEPSGDDRTSIAFTLSPGRPGGLASILGELSDRGINVSRTETRPLPGRFGEYVFFVDFEAHRLDEKAAEALKSIVLRAQRFWMLGAYPRLARPDSMS